MYKGYRRSPIDYAQVGMVALSQVAHQRWDGLSCTIALPVPTDQVLASHAVDDDLERKQCDGENAVWCIVCRHCDHR